MLWIENDETRRAPARHVRFGSLGLGFALALAMANAASAQPSSAQVVYDPPAQSAECKQINKGGPIAGIVVASVFWYVLPMSIPVLITQTKKLRHRRDEIHEQRLRGCP